MRLSVVLVSRNDNYGGHLNTRATFCINTMLDAFDEVIYVDWNSPNGRPLTDDIEITVNPERLKVIVVTPEDARRVMGEERYATGQNCCEVLGRNVGIRRATGDFIVSTNIDIVCPRRAYIEDLMSSLKPMNMATVARYDIDRQMVLDIHRSVGSYQDVRDMIALIRGVDGIGTKLMTNVITMRRETLENAPVDVHFGAASVIVNCGDFQAAHRDTWWAVKGFEESQIKRTFIDTQLQYKVIMAGGLITATNLPPVYHIDHTRDETHSMNERVFVPVTKNDDSWGFADEPFQLRTQILQPIV